MTHMTTIAAVVVMAMVVLWVKRKGLLQGAPVLPAGDGLGNEQQH